MWGKILFLLLLLSPYHVFAEDPFTNISTFEMGEKLTFDIDVLFLDRVAVGSAEIELVDKDEKVFKATVEAKIARFFIQRKNVYESLMKYEPSEKKFKPISFTESKFKKNRSYMKRTFYDKSKSVLAEERWRDGEFESRKEKSLEISEFNEDIITAFYNLRIQAYGTVQDGKNFVVKSMHREGKFYFTINILKGKDKEKIASKAIKYDYNGKFYTEILTPKEVFDAQGGRLFVSFDEYLVPNFVLVKKVIGLGTIRGRLVNVESNLQDIHSQPKESIISKNPGNE